MLSTQKKQILSFFHCRFKGFALVEGKPNVEIIYHVPKKAEPYLKIGFVYRGIELSTVVDMFYGEKKMSSTWIRFAEICKHLYVSDKLL